MSKKTKDEMAQEVCDRLNDMSLSAEAHRVISLTDFRTIYDLFGNCYTADAVENIVSDIIEEDKEDE